MSEGDGLPDIPQRRHDMEFTIEQIEEMICGERVENSDTIAPYGNYTDGLNLEEYFVSNRGVTRWIQVARDPRIGGDIVEFHVSDDEEDHWIVG
jgi:hypothetical protein